MKNITDVFTGRMQMVCVRGIGEGFCARSAIFSINSTCILFIYRFFKLHMAIKPHSMQESFRQCQLISQRESDLRNIGKFLSMPTNHLMPHPLRSLLPITFLICYSLYVPIELTFLLTVDGNKQNSSYYKFPHISTRRVCATTTYICLHHI